MAGTIDVYLERAKRRTFAAAIDWPGWCRSGKSEEDALVALAEYPDRYRRAVGGAGRGPGAAFALRPDRPAEGEGRAAAEDPSFRRLLADPVRHQAFGLARAGPRVGDRGPDDRY